MNIGDIGEDYLSLICSQAGIVVNSSKRDRFGWDHLLEFDIEQPNKVPLDKQENHYKCFIQVKTTEKRVKNVNIKMSNWNYMVQQPLPAFILLVQISSFRKIERVYLSHIHEYWFTKVLRKLRESKSSNLNQHRMKYEAQDSELIEIDNPSVFKNMIISYIGRSMADYSQAKNQLLKTLGYTNFRGKLECVFNSSSDDLIDFSIGKISKMPVGKVKIQDDIRFNIPGEITEFENGLIEIHAEGIPVSVVLSNENGLSVTLEGKLFTPYTLFKSLPKEKFKIRIETDLIEMLFSGQECKVNYHFNLDSCEQTVETFAYQARVCFMLFGGCNFTISRNNETYQLNRSQGIGLANKDFFRFFQNMNQLLTIEFIYNYLSLPKSDKIDLSDILKQTREGNEFRAFLDPMCSELELSFSTNNVDINVTELFIPRIIRIHISSHEIILKGYYIATVIQQNDERYITKPTPKLLNIFIDQVIDDEKEYPTILKHNLNDLKILFVGD